MKGARFSNWANWVAETWSRVNQEHFRRHFRRDNIPAAARAKGAKKKARIVDSLRKSKVKTGMFVKGNLGIKVPPQGRALYETRDVAGEIYERPSQPLTVPHLIRSRTVKGDPRAPLMVNQFVASIGPSGLISTLGDNERMANRVTAVGCRPFLLTNPTTVRGDPGYTSKMP